MGIPRLCLRLTRLSRVSATLHADDALESG